jgi:two-component system cell cycle response regulator DivK
MGYEVMVAKDGLAAIESVVAQLPDLIIMDVQLPKMNGYEPTRRIRAIPAARDIPILAATAKALHGDEAKCTAAGCDGYIAKPFTHRELQAAVHRILKRRLDSHQIVDVELIPIA